MPMIPDKDSFPVQIDPEDVRVLCEGPKTARRICGGEYVEYPGRPQLLKTLRLKAVLVESGIFVQRPFTSFRVGRRRPGAAMADRVFRLIPIHKEARKDACQHRYACMKKRGDLARADELLAKAKQLENRASAISALEAISLRAEAQMLRVQSVCACRPFADEGTPYCE